MDAKLNPLKNPKIRKVIRNCQLGILAKMSLFEVVTVSSELSMSSIKSAISAKIDFKNHSIFGRRTNVTLTSLDTRILIILKLKVMIIFFKWIQVSRIGQNLITNIVHFLMNFVRLKQRHSISNCVGNMVMLASSTKTMTIIMRNTDFTFISHALDHEI